MTTMCIAPHPRSFIRVTGLELTIHRYLVWLGTYFCIELIYKSHASCLTKAFLFIDVLVILPFVIFFHLQTDLNKKYTLFDIGMVEENLMGGMYQSTYTSKKYKSLYPTQFRRVRIELK